VVATEFSSKSGSRSAGWRRPAVARTRRPGRQVGGLVRPVGQQQGLVDGGQLPGDGLVQADELAVDQHEAVFGVVHGVEDLLRRQAHVDGVHHRADHRDGEHAFQVTVAVPVHHRHGVTGLHPGLGQHVGQARDALVELRIGERNWSR
jgi:hypothetical protein